MKTYTNMIALLFMGVLSMAGFRAEIRLPSLFSDNMVLQQQADAAIWGWANSGGTVNLITSWVNRKYTTLADESGKWKLKVKTPVAGGSYEINISDGTVVRQWRAKQNHQ